MADIGVGLAGGSTVPGRILASREAEFKWTLRLDRNGEELGRVRLVRKRLRIGRSRVTTGGIAGLYTAPEHRSKGHAHCLMEASHDFLKKQGCSIVLLNAIPGFYHQFGYDVVFPVYRLFVRTENLLQARNLCNVRRALKRDEPALVRLYNRNNRYRTGTLVRDANWRFASLINYGQPPGILLLAEDGQQRIMGYALCRSRSDRYFVQELNGSSSTAFESLGLAVGKRAHRAGFERIHFRLPIDHPFGRFCGRFGSEWEVQYHVNAEDMGRVLDQSRLLSSLRPELAFRLRESSWNANTCLWFETELGAAGLSVEGNRVRVIRNREPGSLKIALPQTTLLQLAMGYRAVSDVAAEKEVRIHRATQLLLETLFPPAPAIMPMAIE